MSPRGYPCAMDDSSYLIRSATKTLTFWPTLIAVFLVDFATKRWAEGNLLPVYTPHQVIGDAVRLTLAYNRNAAMGLSLGDYSRVGFTLIAVIVLVVIGGFYRRTPMNATGGAAALGLIAAGALGNLTDRVMFLHGVVDFIDIGIGNVRFWTFNIADAAITCGAILLAVLSMRGHREVEVLASSAHTAQP